MTGTLGNVNGYDLTSTKCIIDGFQMSPKLAEYFMGKIKYNAEPINGVWGFKNASDIMFDVAPKDIGIIQPPWLPNLRFSRYSPTKELMCWGSFGIDPDVFKISSPTFYVHKDQIDYYCKISGQNPDLVKPLIFPSDLWQELDDAENQPKWMKDVPKPVLDFVSLLETENTFAIVPDEMLINLHGPAIESHIEKGDNNGNLVHHLSTTQQDDLMRKFILQEKSYTPEAKCSECATSSCKSCRILRNHKSYAAYQAYQRMYADMELVEVNGQQRIQCSYTYREPIEEKFAPQNSNREEALKATNGVIQRLLKIGKLDEFNLQIKDMENMGTIQRLSEHEINDLQNKIHHFNKLNFTISSTSASTPLRSTERKLSNPT